MIERIDHIVLAVADIDRTCEFYARVLGMQVVTFGDNRKALTFGQQKINLHRADKEQAEPKSVQPTAGSGDFCLIAAEPLTKVITHLQECGVEILQGPIQRTGALGPITSVYFRDPDGNLVEISEYETAS